MKRFITLSLFVAFAVGGIYVLYRTVYDDSPLYVKVARRLRSKAGTDLAARWGVFNDCTGSSMYDGVRKIILGFQSGTLFDEQRGRMVVLDATRHLIQLYQANEEIQQYVINGPFCERHVETSLYGPWWIRKSPGFVGINWSHGRMELTYDLSGGVSLSSARDETETLDEAIQHVVDAGLVKGWWQDATGRRWPLFEESLADDS